MVNTVKGQKLFESCKEQIEYYEKSLEEAVIGNEPLRAPAKMHHNYYKFRELINRTSFNKAIYTCLTKEIIVKKVGTVVLKNEFLTKLWHFISKVQEERG